MRTLVVSDLHLGARSGTDVLRRPALREPLLEAAAGCERVVLLGDALELRQGPQHEALAAARPFFEDLGAALGGGEVVLVPGNHDHNLLAGWLERRAAAGEPLGLEQRIATAESAPAREIAAWLGGAGLTLAYPGLWLRDDVYATHGHYLDPHITVPTFERLAAGLMAKVVGPLGPACGPDDYERVQGPLYAWAHAVAQRAAPGRVAGHGGASARVWRTLAGNGHRPVRGALLAGGFGLGIAALNRAGLGPVRANLSGEELRRAGLRAMGEVVRRLEVGAGHVVFGHTHRGGPFPGDRDPEWVAPGGVRLVNSGSWVYEPHFVTAVPGESPYWPGTAVLVEDESLPAVLRLLTGRSHADLRGVRATGPVRA